MPVFTSAVISIHSLRMEGDHLDIPDAEDTKHFNPLPPHGGRHIIHTFVYCAYVHFNPLPPHGGRRLWHKHFGIPEHFNPLPPHGGRRVRRLCTHTVTWNFNPLPPHGGRLCFPRLIQSTYLISIHSLRMEGDKFFQNRVSDFRLISIHSLRMEGDLFAFFTVTVPSLFQSTPSAWRETGLCERLPRRLSISIHSLRMEGDPLKALLNDSPIFPFQSTPSAWRETGDVCECRRRCAAFQSTPSAWRETGLCERLPRRLSISIHSLRMEGDR